MPRIVPMAVLLLSFSQLMNALDCSAPLNGECCWSCPYNLYCPGNLGCYSNVNKGNCPGGTCPAPNDPTPAPKPNPPAPSPAPPAPSPQCADYLKVAKYVAEAVISKGCKAGGEALCVVETGLEGAAACEVIGIGPADPFADICAVLIVTAVTFACGEVCSLGADAAVNAIMKHIASNCVPGWSRAVVDDVGMLHTAEETLQGFVVNNPAMVAGGVLLVAALGVCMFENVRRKA